jgi:hypothetical protein
MERYRPTEVVRDLPQIIDAVAMVRMVMSDDDPIYSDRIRRQQLLAQVRSAIDQQPLAGAFDKDG